MKKNNLNRRDGISLRVTHIALVVCAGVVSLMLIFSTYQSANVFSQLSRATGNYIVRQKAAHDLMEASDYLTEMVQRFTLEGDTQYLDNYFEEAFVSKRREASITNMSENNAEEAMLQQLQQAMDESMSLMYREYYAMKLVIDAKEIREYPETLRAIELKEEDAFRSAEEKMETAQAMVMGPEYYARKEVIRNNLKASLNTMDKLMATARQSSADEMNRELTLVRAVIIALTVIILFLIWLMSHEGTMPLIRAKECAEADKPVPVTGAREFRYMARSYNKMREKLYGDEEDKQ